MFQKLTLKVKYIVRDTSDAWVTPAPTQPTVGLFTRGMYSLHTALFDVPKFLHDGYCIQS